MSTKPRQAQPPKGPDDLPNELPILLDVLGCYDPNNKRIVLFMPTIVDCAERLDKEFHLAGVAGPPCAMTLFYMVFLHELGHALHHLMLKFKTPTLPKNCEAIAQHFTKTCIEAYGNRAEDVFSKLEEHQPSQYHAWRALGVCTWENCRNQFAD